MQKDEGISCFLNVHERCRRTTTEQYAVLRAYSKLFCISKTVSLGIANGYLSLTLSQGPCGFAHRWNMLKYSAWSPSGDLHLKFLSPGLK